MKFLIKHIYESYGKNRYIIKGNKSLIVRLHTFIFSSSLLIKIIFGVKIDDSLHNRNLPHKNKRNLPHKYDITTILLKNYLKNIINKNNKKLKVLEIGTGYYGILSIYLKKKFDVDIVATDLDPKAIKSTKLNLNINNVKIGAFDSNLFQNINYFDFDIIFWNLPYYRKVENYLVPLIEQSDQYLSQNGKLILGYNSSPLNYETVIEISKKNKKLTYDNTVLYSWNQHAISVIKKN